MRRIGRLRNSIQRYAWGCKRSIPSLLGHHAPASEPHAEMWMGAHPKAPSKLAFGDRDLCLLEAIQRDPAALLGETVAARFDGQLPFLFKVLAAEEPLSIQAHPDLEQARRGFAREEERKIPRDAPHRNYRDPNHKPEVICALETFDALRGFRPIEEIIALFEILALPKPLHRSLEKKPDPQGLRAFFSSLLHLQGSEKFDILQAIRSKLQTMRLPPGTPRTLAASVEPSVRAWLWVQYLTSAYPEDIGILAPLFLNLVRLEPGEAMFLPAGELHAYLGGFGVEIMANSDNVLRGGLTPKHIDIPELLQTLHFQGGRVEILHPVPLDATASLYPAPATEFALSRLALRNGQPWKSPSSRSAEILLCVEGSAVIIEDNGDSISLARGDSVFLPALLGPYTLQGQASIFRAFVP